MPAIGGTDVDEKNNKMKEFIDANPGIKSRINSTFYFPSYTAPEMAEIFKKHVEMSGYELPEGWKEPVTAYFADRVMMKLGNAVRPEHYLKKSLSRWQNGSWPAKNGEQKKYP